MVICVSEEFNKRYLGPKLKKSLESGAPIRRSSVAGRQQKTAQYPSQPFQPSQHSNVSHYGYVFVVQRSWKRCDRRWHSSSKRPGAKTREVEARSSSTIASLESTVRKMPHTLENVVMLVHVSSKTSWWRVVAVSAIVTYPGMCLQSRPPIWTASES